MMTRADLLGQIMKITRFPIAVSGTHGKTTTTSMASHILLEGGFDPTISVGGILPASAVICVWDIPVLSLPRPVNIPTAF